MTPRQAQLEEVVAHTEWVDDAGIATLRAFLCQSNHETLSPVLRQRRTFLISYIDAIDAVYGPAVEGPNGAIARPLRCVYARVREGRLFCRAHVGPSWSKKERSFICAQGMPGVLRPFLMRQWAHDIDIENCHVVLLYQLGRCYHAWQENAGKNVAPLQLPELQRLHDNREEFIEHISTVHRLRSDGEAGVGYRKSMCKPLLLRILYGGTYDAWLQEHDLFFSGRSPRVVRLQQEVAVLSDAFLRSERFSPIVRAERVAQRQRLGQQVARSTFSKIGQYLECEVLLSMRRYFLESGWDVHSLIFDGLTVAHRADTPLDLRAVAAFVELDTQFVVRVTEKPLFGVTPSCDTLLA
tara:strand:- start:682 stop:1740 length:1059 start_codon:yes stop_codon:yes gene_type:complete